ncbi:MAG: LEA type 2 family protein [Thermoplasmata archaeon]|nr:MAG: LEA type 2 family protein [Thermoplasmata archaeon]
MRKKLTIILTIFLLLNILLSAFLIMDFKSFKLPIFDVHLEVLDIQSESVTLEISVEMENTNSFSVAITNLDVDIQTDQENVVGSINVKGGEIPGGEIKTFNTISKINLEDYEAGLITSRIRGDLKIDFLGFLTKTIPMDISITSALDLLFNNVLAPEISIHTEFGDIDSQGVPLNIDLDFRNPNTFSLYINDLDIYTYHDNANETAHVTIEGGPIEPGNVTQFSASVIIGLNTFDYGTLKVSAGGEVGVKIAGFRHFMPFSVEASMEVPRIGEFIFNDEPLDISIMVDFNTVPLGVKTIVVLEIYNPGNVDFYANDMMCFVYKIDGDSKILVGQDEMYSCETNSEKDVCVRTEIIIPYSEFATEGEGQGVPEWFLISIIGELQIGTTNQMLPLEVDGYYIPMIVT